MIDWPVGLSTGCFYKKNILEILPKIRKYGFTRLEINSSASHIDCSNMKMINEVRDYIENNGLEAYSMHAPFSSDIDISSNDERIRKYSIEKLMQSCVAGGILNIRYFVMHPGPSIDFKTLAHHEISARRKNMIRSMHEIARVCNANNIRLTIENMLAHLLFGDMGDLFNLFSSMKDIYTPICLDTGHAFLAGNLMEMIHLLSHQIRMIHAADNFGAHDDHVPPGRGYINWPHVIYALHKVNFCGTLIIELADDDRKDDYDILKEAMQGKRYLREIERNLYMSMDLPVKHLISTEALELPDHSKNIPQK